MHIGDRQGQESQHSLARLFVLLMGATAAESDLALSLMHIYETNNTSSSGYCYMCSTR